MSRKTAGIIAIVIAAIIFIYMFSKGSSQPVEKDTATPPPAAEAPSEKSPDTAAKPVMDEQEKTLENLKKSAEAASIELSHLYIVKCSSCHGRNGKGPVGPSIAGKDKEYNMAALLKYKDGQVPNTLMKGILERTSIEDLEMLAAEVSSFK